MNKLLLDVLKGIAAPFVSKKVSEVVGSPERPTPDQATTQIGKIGLGATLVGFTQVDSPEQTIAMIAVLAVNLFFLYYPQKKS